MKKLLIALVSVAFLLIIVYGFAQTGEPWSNPVPWKADPASQIPGDDIVTIQTGEGLETEVQIVVDRHSTGADITNCGGTTHINPGSSGICTTGDPTTPIKITSDSVSQASVGLYQIRTKSPY